MSKRTSKKSNTTPPRRSERLKDAYLQDDSDESEGESLLSRMKTEVLGRYKE
jgi:hypothetical protein